MQGAIHQPSNEFVTAVQRSINLLHNDSDERVAFMSYHIEVIPMRGPDAVMRKAGGCETCMYLGLWVDKWPGYPPAEHGYIFVYESGIRNAGEDLLLTTRMVIIHEMDHALQRDHVLEDMGRQKAAAFAMGQTLSWQRASACCGG